MIKILNKIRSRLSNNSLGFTLLEAMIAIAIIGVIGYILSDIITRGFRGSSKTQLIGLIKQNGQVAINTIEQTVRFADSIVCTSSSPYQAIGLQTKEGKFIRFSFQSATPTQNGFIAEQQWQAVTDPDDLIHLCDGSPPFSITSAQVSLTDRDAKAGVSVTSGRFRRYSQFGLRDAIDVKFDIEPGVGGDRTSFENQLGDSGKVTFQTTIQLR